MWKSNLYECGKCLVGDIESVSGTKVCLFMWCTMKDTLELNATVSNVFIQDSL